MGPSAAPAVPALAQALSDPHPDLRYFVARALSQIGPAAAPALPEVIAALRSNNLDQEKSLLIITLGNIGPPAALAVPLLIEMMSLEKTDFTRADAAEALGKIGDEEGLSSLVRALKTDESDHVRRAAAYAIAKFGERARFAVPTLVESLNDEDISVRGASAYAIAQITDEPFPYAERDDGTFRIGDNGEPYIVIAAREWWEKEGQFQDWGSP
jgi:HEAT repeat protein